MALASFYLSLTLDKNLFSHRRLNVSRKEILKIKEEKLNTLFLSLDVTKWLGKKKKLNFKPSKELFCGLIWKIFQRKKLGSSILISLTQIEKKKDSRNYCSKQSTITVTFFLGSIQVFEYFPLSG